MAARARPAAAQSRTRARLRETLHRLLRGQDKTPAARDLAAERGAGGGTQPHTSAARAPYPWDVDAKCGSGRAAHAQSLWSAARPRPRLNRVRRCANPESGWLFLDEHRARQGAAGARCRSCGNRAEARRHYHKSKAA